jgi:hypothetical protein
MTTMVLVVEVMSTSETPVMFHLATRRNVPEVVFILAAARILTLTKIDSFTAVRISYLFSIYRCL